MMTKHTCACLAIVMQLAFAALAVAADKGGAERSIFGGSLGNVVITAIVFVIVVYVLGKFAWPPIMNGLNERERVIRESLENAKNEREEAKALLAEYTAQIDRAREEASVIVEQGRKNAESTARRIQDEAREEAGKIVERAKREITLATDAAKTEVYELAAELSLDVAKRVVRKELSPSDHRDLIKESLKAMEEASGKLN